MKVGIVTQPLYANYGGILQNYALQQVLKKMGHEPVTLDYMPSLSFGRYLLYAGKTLVCAFSPSRRHPMKPYKHFLKRPESIDSFVRNNIETTKIVPDYTKNLLKKNGIEAVIVGSDQVWRYGYNSSHIEDMYLAFAKDYNCIKLAYAASFGVEKWTYSEKLAKEVRELIKQFNAVSVREDSAADICREVLDVEAKTVLDPTLLLSATDYQPFCKGPVPGEKPYLAAYVLDINDEKNNYIDAVAKANGLEVKRMTVTDSGCSIEEWLTTIKNASYVITDSYHGSLFSIILEKQFQSFINKKRGADRFYTLFKRLGIQDSLLDCVPATSVISGRIDYSHVQKRLTELQRDSLGFIKDYLR